MRLLGAATSPRTPPSPEDHASTSSWIQAQDWRDDRKQLAHEELHKRVGLANRQRTAAQNAAKETGLALAHTLGPGFISVNQLPPAVRRDLPDDALAALTLRADRNVHPVTVVPHGDVATKLNRMAATDPEGFAKVDLRLAQDRMTPGEYSSLEDTQEGMASYPPAPATVTQRNLWDEIRRNGLDDDATPGAGAVPPSSDEAQVEHLANVETIPEALRVTDAIKDTVPEMLRRDWTPDQIQNQLYEAYVRRSTGLNSGPVDQEGSSDQLGSDQWGKPLANDQPGVEDNATGTEQTAQLIPAGYGKAKRRTPKAKQPSAADALPEWARRRNLSVWRSPVYLSTSQDSPDKDIYDGLKRMGNPDDLTIIFSHGSPESGKTTDKSRGQDPVTRRDDREMDAKDIYVTLRQKNFVQGTPILLTSCFGANDDAARQLSAMTGGIVYVAKAYVLAPSAANHRYDLSVHTDGPRKGERSGYAKFNNGKEVPSELLALRYNEDTHQWSRLTRTPPAPVGDRVPAPLSGWARVWHDLTRW